MHDQIKKEYFELINKLNQSNKIKDLNTEIYFYISHTSQLFIAVSADQKILLCQKTVNNFWIPAHLSGFDNFEKFVAMLLNSVAPSDNPTKLIKSELFKLE